MKLYHAKKSGELVLRTPHGGEEVFIGLCADEAGLVADMLNFAVEKGFVFPDPTEKNEKLSKPAKEKLSEAGDNEGDSSDRRPDGRKKAVKKKSSRPRRRTTEEVLHHSAASGVLCSWCGQEMVITAPGKSPYCRPCSVAYTRGYSQGLAEVSDAETPNGALRELRRLKASGRRTDQLKSLEMRQRAREAGAAAREASIRARGLKPLRTV